VGLGKKKEE
jgi:hypothetical protein